MGSGSVKKVENHAAAFALHFIHYVWSYEEIEGWQAKGEGWSNLVRVKKSAKSVVWLMNSLNTFSMTKSGSSLAMKLLCGTFQCLM